VVSVRINFFVDFLLGICFVIMLVTGLLKFPGLPELFGIHRGNFPLGTISFYHDYTGLLLLLFIIIHLLLHRRQVACAIKSVFGGNKKCEK